MAKFLVGSKLTAEIHKILAEPRSRCAVAFWGHGSEDWVTGANSRIIANLRTGGTNPYALQKVKAAKQQCDTLHAKVYIGARGAIVASANASVNGLALEGLEQRGWIEAGLYVDDVHQVGDWFENLWENGSSEITGADWKKAEALWRLRQKAKPPLQSFADFDPTAERLPLVVWTPPKFKWSIIPEAVEAAVGSSDSDVRRRVHNGLWVHNSQDERSAAGRWALIWVKTSGGKPSKRLKPWFTLMSEVVVRGGIRWEEEGEPQDVVLAAEDAPLPPFNTTEPQFVDSFSKVITKPAFAALLEDDQVGQPWYERHEGLLQQFWVELRSAYIGATR